MAKAVSKKQSAPASSLSPRALATQRAAELEARCPFCRDEIQVETIGWTCCTLCLSRHHSECWREHGCCASCGGDQNLTFVTVRDDLRRRRGSAPDSAAPSPWLRKPRIWLGALLLTSLPLLWLTLFPLVPQVTVYETTPVEPPARDEGWQGPGGDGSEASGD